MFEQILQMRRIIAMFMLSTIGFAHSASAQIVDYPGGGTEHGSVVVRLQINPQGGVGGCEVQRFTMIESLDSAACQMLKDARFNPATDEAGHPSSSVQDFTLHFIVPHAAQSESDLPIGPNHFTFLYDPSRAKAQKDNGVTGLGQARKAQQQPTNAQLTYPSRALRKGEQGRVYVTLDIDREGKPGRCSVVRTSGSSDLDSATCAYAAKNVRYIPASDHFGNTIESVALFSLNWALD